MPRNFAETDWPTLTDEQLDAYTAPQDEARAREAEREAEQLRKTRAEQERFVADRAAYEAKAEREAEVAAAERIAERRPARGVEPLARQRRCRATHPDGRICERDAGHDGIHEGYRPTEHFGPWSKILAWTDEDASRAAADAEARTEARVRADAEARTTMLASLAILAVLAVASAITAAPLLFIVGTVVLVWHLIYSRHP